MKPTSQQLARILPHIRYEIEQCFYVPKHDSNDPHIRESVFLAMLIHARLLVEFFETKETERDDVLCIHFGFPVSKIPIKWKDKLRLNKDIAHLTYSRLRHTLETKSWPIESILLSLRPTVVKFVQHIIAHPPIGIKSMEFQAWQKLNLAFT